MTLNDLPGMIAPTLDGSEAKLSRAKAQLDMFSNEVSAFRDEHPCTLRVDHQPQERKYVFTVHGVVQPDPDWGLLAGECLYNLRCAMDHLVYQLAVAALGRDLTPDEARTVQFPVFTSLDQFNQRGNSYIKLLRTGERARIAELQPFNSWDASIWGSDGFTTKRVRPANLPSRLLGLCTLNNIDKHQTVHPVWSLCTWWEADPLPQGVSGTTFGGALKDGAEVGSWEYSLVPDFQLAADVDMNRYFPVGIGIGNEEGAMCDAVETLTWSYEAVRDVLTIFRPCVVEGGPPLPLASFV